MIRMVSVSRARGLAIVIGVAASLSLFGANQPAPPVDDSSIAVNQTQEDCAKLMKDPFPDLIVEQVLTKKGIAPSQIKEINEKLDNGATKISEKFSEEFENTEEPVATNDPLSDVYNTDTLEGVKRDVFLEVMAPYITDAQLGVDMFNAINAKRETALEACAGAEGAK